MDEDTERKNLESILSKDMITEIIHVTAEPYISEGHLINPIYHSSGKASDAAREAGEGEPAYESQFLFNALSGSGLDHYIAQKVLDSYKAELQRLDLDTLSGIYKTVKKYNLIHAGGQVARCIGAYLFEYGRIGNKYQVKNLISSLQRGSVEYIILNAPAASRSAVLDAISRVVSRYRNFSDQELDTKVDDDLKKLGLSR